MTSVVPFAPPPPHGRAYTLARFVPEGRKRKCWHVIEREPDGTETVAYRCRTERDAIWMQATLRKAEEKRQAELEELARHPIGKQLLSIDIATRDTLRRIFIAEARLRGVTD